jgi:serine/threonine-protein kinase HipA
MQHTLETEGVNLHTFFAGLLPEGLRFEALVRAAKTSRDDLFSLLLLAGSEAIGDVRVMAIGERNVVEVHPPWRSRKPPLH